MTTERGYFSNLGTLIDANDRSTIARQNPGERVLNQVIWRWFSRVDLASQVAAALSDSVTVRYPSFGFSLLNYQQVSLFGAPVSAKFVGLSMDVDFVASIDMPRDGDARQRILLAEIEGGLSSAAEAAIPEALFSRNSIHPKWASTTTLLSAANAQGVALTEVNQGNIATVLPALNLPTDIKNKMADNVNAGLKVITPQNNVTQQSFSGVGFIVEDPQTGSAAYEVTGGRSGGEPTTEEVNEELRNLGLSILTTTGGAALSLGDNLISLLRGVVEAVDCIFPWVSPQEGLVALAAVALIVVVAVLVFVYLAPFLTGALVGTLFGLSGGIVTLSAILLDVLIGGLIGNAANASMRSAAGCPPNN
jgi:hypothetical protein